MEILFNLLFIAVSILFVQAEHNLCNNGLDYWCLSQQNAEQCGITASLSVTYCDGYFKQQQDALVCDEGGINYWCAHKKTCGVTSGECADWAREGKLKPIEAVANNNHPAHHRYRQRHRRRRGHWQRNPYGYPERNGARHPRRKHRRYHPRHRPRYHPRYHQPSSTHSSSVNQPSVIQSTLPNAQSSSYIDRSSKPLKPDRQSDSHHRKSTDSSESDDHPRKPLKPDQLSNSNHKRSADSSQSSDDHPRKHHRPKRHHRKPKKSNQSSDENRPRKPLKPDNKPDHHPKKPLKPLMDHYAGPHPFLVSPVIQTQHRAGNPDMQSSQMGLIDPVAPSMVIAPPIPSTRKNYNETIIHHARQYNGIAANLMRGLPMVLSPRVTKHVRTKRDIRDERPPHGPDPPHRPDRPHRPHFPHGPKPPKRHEPKFRQPHGPKPPKPHEPKFRQPHAPKMPHLPKEPHRPNAPNPPHREST